MLVQRQTRLAPEVSRQAVRARRFRVGRRQQLLAAILVGVAVGVGGGAIIARQRPHLGSHPRLHVVRGFQGLGLWRSGTRCNGCGIIGF